MRQDQRFHPGEAITSISFARLVSSAFDCLATVDPHLHRHQSLNEIYSIPAKAVQSAAPIAEWIGRNEDKPLLIGPDIESEQWVADVAQRIGAPYRILQKNRLGDRSVRIAIPDLTEFAQYTPVLLDDIVSSGQTMIETAQQLRIQGLSAPTCIAVHALLSEDAGQALMGVAKKFISTNTVQHESNAIDVSGVLAESLLDLLSEVRPDATLHGSGSILPRSRPSS
jgi:ribose-phosphate pyrophosphokinase